MSRRKKGARKGLLIRAPTAARIAGVCTDTIVRWIQKGELVGRQIGGAKGHWYVQRASFEALMYIRQ